jgi:Rho-binding antiterminator
MTDRAGPDAYRPISCALHSEYEVAILHRAKLHLTWCADNVVYNQRVLPLDLRTRNGEEFLICRTENGEPREIRLDTIRRMERA